MANIRELPIVTKSMIRKDLQHLGVLPWQVVMLHVSTRAMGWIVGGQDIMLQALLDQITDKGTLMMLAGWEDCPYDLPDWSLEKQLAYLEECPPFDPVSSRANRKWSVLTEYMRTRSGAHRSAHPVGSFVAIGLMAPWVTENHRLQYGYGPGSPFAKLCDAGGKVLVLGAPLYDVALLGYAECLAKVRNKRVVNYRMPVLRDGKRVWVDIEEYDTKWGIVDWAGEDYFELIVQEYLSSGKGNSRKVGSAWSYLFDANDLVNFAVH